MALVSLAFFILTAAAVPVDPSVTGDGIVATVHEETGVRKSHEAYFDEKSTLNGRLLITLGGTNSFPSDMRAFGEVGARLGFMVVGVDYPNSVVTTKCRGKDENCFDRFRREIVLGESVSELVEVDRANSLENRIAKLLQFLARERSEEGWGTFVGRDGAPAWKKIVLAGHSQGSGHAAFLSKRHEVAGVILLAGPQDGDTWGIAPWVRAPGLTPGERYVGLLHVRDYFGSEFQLAGIQALKTGTRMQLASYDGVSVTGQASTILAGQPAADPHMSVIGPGYLPAWKALFQFVTPVQSASK